MITSDFDQIFEDMSAPEYPATCDSCGEAGTNASMVDHECLTKEEAELVAGVTPLQALPSKDDYLDSQEFYELVQVYRHAAVPDQNRVIAAFEEVKIYIRNQYHSLTDRLAAQAESLAQVVEERNQLREERKRLLTTLRQSRNAAQVFIGAQYLDTARQGLTQIVSDIDKALAARETEEEGR